MPGVPLEELHKLSVGPICFNCDSHKWKTEKNSNRWIQMHIINACLKILLTFKVALHVRSF